MKPVVIKVGGHEIGDLAFLTELAETVRDYDAPVVIVHGGGAEISTLQKLMGITPRYLDGIRITDEPSLAVVEMVLCGVVNKRLVRHLMNAGVDAMGVSGVDRGIVCAVKMTHPTQDMGLTGVVTKIREAPLLEMLSRDITPVIAPVSLGTDAPVSYNVNADHVAGAVAGAISASKVIFITNVEGVLVNGERATAIAAPQAHALIEDGTIWGGMIPKVTTALETLTHGVPQAVITNLTGLKSHGGTSFTPAGATH